MSFSITATATYFSAYQYETKANNWKSSTVASSKPSDERKNANLNKDTQSSNQNSNQSNAKITQSTTEESNLNRKFITGSQQIASMPTDDNITIKDVNQSSTTDNGSETEQAQGSSQSTNKDKKVMTGSEQIASMPEKGGESKGVGSEALSEEEKQQVQELKKRDAEVKTHEQAHLSAGGSYVRGGANYSYETGPDGMKYAVGGEVQIDTAPVKGDPEATIIKAQVIRGAALAPAQPSSQDQAVAAQASKMMQEAQSELMQKNMTESNGSSTEKTDSSDKSKDKKSENGSNLKSNIESIYQKDTSTNSSESEKINLVA